MCFVNLRKPQNFLFQPLDDALFQPGNVALRNPQPVGQQKTLEKTENCEVERTGLHSREFIDTIRYTLSGPHTISMDDTVHVMNLVEGRSARIESMDGSFAPFTAHYAETAIVPAAVGTYRIVPEEGEMIKMLVASVG